MTRWAKPRGAGCDSELRLARADDARARPGRVRDRVSACLSISPPGELAPHAPHVLWLLIDLVEAAIRANHRRRRGARRGSEAGARGGDLAAPGSSGASGQGDGRIRRGAASAALSECSVARTSAGGRLTMLGSSSSTARYLRRARATGEARVHLGRALEGFRVLGAQPWAEKAAGELRAAGAATGRPPADVAVSLTPQQLEIAQLAAQGLTNKQIGERLFLSHRTVATHLYQLYPKLGITSRAALSDALATIAERSAEPERTPRPPHEGPQPSQMT